MDLNGSPSRVKQFRPALAMAAFGAVLDDDNLLRAICEFGDADFLRTARFVSSRTRTFASVVIHERLRDFRVVEAAASGSSDQHLKDMVSYECLWVGYADFLARKLSVYDTVAADELPGELTEGGFEEIHRTVRDVHLKRYENAILPAVLCETCPATQMQQIVLFIAALRAEGLTGPHVILTSAPTDWQRVFEKIAPSIPLIVNEGTPWERKNKAHQRNCAWLSSYALAMKDMQNQNLRDLFFTSPAIFLDQGLMELRRGWKKNSPTWKLYHALTTKTKNWVHFLGNHASATSLTDEEAKWFMCGAQLRAIVGAAPDYEVSHFYNLLRCFGVGKRDAPQFVNTLAHAMLQRMVVASPVFHFHETTGTAGTAGSSGAGGRGQC